MVFTRTMAASLSAETKKYLDDLFAPLVKNDDLTSMEERIKADILSKVDANSAKLIALEGTVNDLSSRLEILEETVNGKDAELNGKNEEIKTLRGKLDSMDTKVDHLESYSRRPCLRITGLAANKGESRRDVINLVMGCFEDINAKVPLKHIDRIHRVGEVRLNKFSKVDEQDIIVKFKDWEERCLVYKSRPRWHKISQDPNMKKPARRFAIKLDLSAKRSKLLNYAIELKKNANTNSSVDYIFADINCNLVCKLNNGSFKYFNCESDIIDIIREN